jgi:oligopeptide transport system permease protein
MPGAILNIQEKTKPARTPMQLALARFRRNKLAVFSIFAVAFIIAMALTANIFAPFAPNYQSAVVQDSAPGTVDPATNRVNILGSDNLGRDILTRLMYGSRVSLAVGFVANFVVLAVGVPLGLMAGFFGGLVDNLIMRFTDIMYAFPSLLFVIIIVTTFGRSLWVIFIALGLTSWVTMTRLVRGQVLQIKQMDYVTSSRSLGARSIGLIRRHVLPNVMGPILVVITLGIPEVIIAEATLTYLGLGVDPSTPSWGTMVNAAVGEIYSRPTQVIVPAFAIAAITLAFTFVGDGVSDALDPRRK